MSNALIPILNALAHPSRLAVFDLLMQRYPHELSAGQIASLLALRPSTLSGYLAQLAEAGLIEARRMGTTLNYRACPRTAQGFTQGWLTGPCRGKGWAPRLVQRSAVLNVLFAGRGNAGPTLAAEALLRHHWGDRVEAFSAGSDPAAAPDPALIAALDARGVETAPLWSKPLSAFLEPDAPRIDILICLESRSLAPSVQMMAAAHTSVWRLDRAATPNALLDALMPRLGAVFDLPADASPDALQDALDAQALPNGTA